MISLPFYGKFRPDTWFGKVVQRNLSFLTMPASPGSAWYEIPQIRMLDDVFPSFIWTFAFTVAMCHLWWNADRSREPWFWILLPCLINIIWECGQYTGILRGTGSLADILAGLVAQLLFFFLQHKQKNTNL
jgi:hypothetical protein